MDKSRPLNSVEDILPHLDFIRNKKQEYLVCLSLNNCNQLIKKRVVTIGTVNSTMIHPREIFAGPIQDRAVSVVIAHNHPSGNPEPSWQDIVVTQHIIAAGSILGIKIRDHIIVTTNDHRTFLRHGLI